MPTLLKDLRVYLSENHDFSASGDNGVWKKSGLADTIIVHDDIVSFLKTFSEGKTQLREQDFKKFIDKLDTLRDSLKSVIFGMVFDIAIKIKQDSAEEIESAERLIDNSINNSVPIPQKNEGNGNLIGLINVYNLMSHETTGTKFISSNQLSVCGPYPNVDKAVRESLSIKIPFAINALTMTGQRAPGLETPLARLTPSNPLQDRPDIHSWKMHEGKKFYYSALDFYKYRAASGGV